MPRIESREEYPGEPYSLLSDPRFLLDSVDPPGIERFFRQARESDICLVCRAPRGINVIEGLARSIETGAVAEQSFVCLKCQMFWPSTNPVGEHWHRISRDPASVCFAPGAEACREGPPAGADLRMLVVTNEEDWDLLVGGLLYVRLPSGAVRWIEGGAMDRNGASD